MRVSASGGRRLLTIDRLWSEPFVATRSDQLCSSVMRNARCKHPEKRVLGGTRWSACVMRHRTLGGAHVTKPCKVHSTVPCVLIAHRRLGAAPEWSSDSLRAVGEQDDARSGQAAEGDAQPVSIPAGEIGFQRPHQGPRDPVQIPPGPTRSHQVQPEFCSAGFCQRSWA